LFSLSLFGCIYTRATNLEANHAYQLLTVGKKNTDKRSERKIKVDKNEVKVKTPPPSKEDRNTAVWIAICHFQANWI
jgi:hypothetical protein